MKKIIFTQPLSSSSKLEKRLNENDFEVIRFPMVQTERVAPDEDLSNVLKEINSFSWLIFTSKNAIRHLFPLLEELEYDFPKKKIAVIGEKTAKTLKQYGYEPNYINTGNTSHDFVDELKGVIRKNSRVLAVLGNLAPDTLEIGLKDYVNFHRINVYETKPTEIDETALRILVESGSFDRVIFTSPSAINRMRSVLGDIWQKLNKKCICIGSVTAEALQENDIEALSIAEKPAEKGLFDAIEASFE